MNASVAPVMMSLHLWHFDKQLFKDCSILPRHHTLLINKSREQYFSKITHGDYKFRITIAIFSIPATIFACNAISSHNLDCCIANLFIAVSLSRSRSLYCDVTIVTAIVVL